jgi:hypothetical protein
LIHDAIHDTNERGRIGAYFYNVMPKQLQPGKDDTRRGVATSLLMKAIQKTRTFELLALKFHDVLMKKVLGHRFLVHHLDHVQVVLKGGFAQHLLNLHEGDIASDMDLVIYINPGLPEDMFHKIRETLSTLVLQSMSQYKRTLDHMLFLNQTHQSAFLCADDLRDFKRALREALAEAYVANDARHFVSPMDDDIVRNKVSRNSFIITDSRAIDNSVVRIEVPHFEMCETIPLRKTPLVCSHNRSIRFLRNSTCGTEEGGAPIPIPGAFDLYRLRFNLMHCGDSGTTDTCDTVTADLIDVSIPAYDDSEQLCFWTKTAETGQRPVIRIADGRLDHAFNIPSVSCMIEDLRKMLYVYDCPESKRTKRQGRYEQLLRCQRGDC